MSNMVVRTNVFALNAHRNMKNVGAQQQRASNRLSSGYRINSAADDAAGLAISESMRAQIRGLDQASRNTQDGQALINTAEGGMQEMQNMIQRIRELTVQAANDTNDNENRIDHIALEIRNLLLEIDDMANRVEYNGMVLLDGRFSASATAAPGTGGDFGDYGDGGLRFQVGANEGQLMWASIADMRLFERTNGVRDTDPSIGDNGAMYFDDMDVVDDDTSLGEAMSVFINDFEEAFAGAGATGTTAEQISALIGSLDDGLEFVSLARANLGAISNRLDFTMRSLDISSENLSDAESRVRNADMAREMMQFTMANVLQQASVSMLAQANQLPNNLLQLLR